MRAGFWNVRGWKTDCNSDNYVLRDMCIKHLDFDLIGIAETHLTGIDVLNIDDYQWFGSNRQNIHIRARTGSGGVGFLIHDELCSIYDISVVFCDIWSRNLVANRWHRPRVGIEWNEILFGLVPQCKPRFGHDRDSDHCHHDAERVGSLAPTRN